MTKHTQLLKLLAVVISWRVALYFIAAVAPLFLSYKGSFVGAETLLALEPFWLTTWAGFDGIHYITLATRGYLAVGFIQAFFPAFPLVLATIHAMTNNLVATIAIGQLLTLSFFVGALYLFKEVISIYVPKSKGSYWWLVALILLFPTSYYFGSLYTESLFLVLTLAAFLSAAKKRWWLAGLLVALASATRVVGIFLVPALLIELAVQTDLLRAVRSGTTACKTWIGKHWHSVMAISLGSIGLLAYSCYLWYHFNDPLYFFHVQSEFGGGRQESIVLFPQVVWRYLKILTSVPFDLRYVTYSLEFLSGVGGLIILVVGIKKVRFSLWFFSICALLLPTLTGTFSSMSRYILVVPAFFLILNELLATRPVLRVLWLIVSAALLIINTVLFVQGYWVA